MKKIPVIIGILFFWTVTVQAQGDFCSNLNQVIESSYYGFTNLPKDFTIPGVGKGLISPSFLHAAVWDISTIYTSVQEATNKYENVIFWLSSCNIEGSPMRQKIYDKEQLKSAGLLMCSEWTLPNPLAHHATKMSVMVTCWKDDYGAGIRFDVANGNATDKLPNAADVVITNEPPVPNSASPDFCNALTKGLKSGYGFKDIRGPINNGGSYEGNVSFPGSAGNYITNPTLGSPRWIIDFAKTTDVAEAALKYKELKNMIGGCSFWFGSLVESERVEASSSTTSYIPLIIDEQHKKIYGGLSIMVIQQDMGDHLEVYLRVIFDADAKSTPAPVSIQTNTPTNLQPKSVNAEPKDPKAQEVYELTISSLKELGSFFQTQSETFNQLVNAANASNKKQETSYAQSVVGSTKNLISIINSKVARFRNLNIPNGNNELADLMILYCFDMSSVFDSFDEYARHFGYVSNDRISFSEIKARYEANIGDLNKTSAKIKTLLPAYKARNAID